MKKAVAVFLTLAVVVISIYFISKPLSDHNEDNGAVLSFIDKIKDIRKTDFSKVKLIYDNDKSKFYYHKLSQNAKIAYTLILKTIDEQPERVEIPDITSEELDAILYSLSYDNPELLSIGRTCKVECDKTGTKFYFKMSYNYSKNEKDAKEAELDKVINQIISEAPVGGSYDKELYIHDYVCKNCTYDINEEQNGTSYDALVEGKTLCEGYARAIKVLLDRMDIPNYLITGKATNYSGKTESHMWNVVEIEGKRYHLDATWNDTNLGSGDFCHLYFNMNDEEIKLDHTELLPEENNCIDNSQSYFKNEGLLFDRYNINFIKKALIKEGIKNLKNGRQSVEIKFTNKSSFNACLKSLIKSSDIYEILDEINGESGTAYKSVSYFESEELNFIEFFFS